MKNYLEDENGFWKDMAVEHEIQKHERDQRRQKKLKKNFDFRQKKGKV